MSRIPILMALAATGTLATGCAQSAPALQAEHNPSLYSVHQPVVQRTDYVLDLSTANGGLGAYEMGRLRGWFDSLGITYGDRISIDTGSGYSDGQTRGGVAEIAAAYGLLLDEGAPVTEGVIAPGSVRIVVSRAVATVPGCPNWGNTMGSGTRTETASNYGCATNANLAAMIADPNDLLIGRTSSGGDATAASKPVKSYRDRIQSGVAGVLKAESTGGK